MTGAEIFALLGIINGALAMAPKAIDLVKHSKDFITALFTAGLITKEQQDSSHAYVDVQAALVAAGIVPLSWQVRPDPVGVPVVNMPVDSTKDVLNKTP